VTTILDAARITKRQSLRGHRSHEENRSANHFFSILLSCSQSRTWTQTLVSGKTAARLNKGGRDQRRRLNKLSCAGWLPHDPGFRLGLPRSRRERRPGPAHNRSRGFPDRALPPAVSAWRCGWCGPCPPLLQRPLHCRSARHLRLNLARDGPDEARHLARDRGGDDNLWLTAKSRAPPAAA
jgi:hypothetical protein